MGPLSQGRLRSSQDSSLRNYTGTLVEAASSQAAKITLIDGDIFEIGNPATINAIPTIILIGRGPNISNFLGLMLSVQFSSG